METSKTLLGTVQTALDDVLVKGRMRAFRVLKSGVLTIPSPALLAALSGNPVIVGGVAALTLAGLVLLVWPSGVMGIVLCLLAWCGSLALGACGVQIGQLQRQIDQLNDEMAGLRETRHVWERDLLNRVGADSPRR